MKKIVGLFLSIAVTIAMVIDGYIMFFFHKNHTKLQQSSNTSSNSSTAVTKDKKIINKSQKYHNGTFTGNPISTKWGVVQVSAIIANGRIKKTVVLKYPDSNPKSKSINAQALPVYKASAIKAQNAHIQHISGATETYKGFTSSLQSALNKAE